MPGTSQDSSALRDSHTCPPPSAGAPPANNTFFCDAGTLQCYSYNTEVMSFDNATAYCANMGGSLFTPRTLAQQLMVENYLKLSPLTDYYYWLGIRRRGLGPFEYVAGTPTSMLQHASNVPYAHWSSYHSVANRSANYDCVIAQQAFRYELYLGDTNSSAQLSDSRYYNTNPSNTELVYGWNSYPCTGKMDFVCQAPASSFPCLPSPSPPRTPSSPPPPPSPPVDPGLGSGASEASCGYPGSVGCQCYPGVVTSAGLLPCTPSRAAATSSWSLKTCHRLAVLPCAI